MRGARARSRVEIETLLRERTRPSPDGCLIYTGKVGNKGYGRLGWRGVNGAHRVAYTLAHGAIPKGLLVCHRCDVPLCVNPHHLFVGTNSDNMADMHRKGRAQCGNLDHAKRSPVRHCELAGKLTWEDVRAIRASSSALAELAQSFGVHVKTIRRVRARKTWACAA